MRHNGGYDFKRAIVAFGDLTVDQLDKPCGNSNLTPRKILAGYQRDRKGWQANMDMVEKLRVV